jgi:AcrR family transcriptional regulator
MDLAILSARDRILVTAHDLFYRDGIRATGVDRIIAASGVAKLTFYRHFASKDDLVRAFLDYRHERWMAWFVDALGRHGATPGGGLAPLAEAMAEWFADPAFRGCAFINAVTELGGSVGGVTQVAAQHKQDMVDVIAALLPASAQHGDAALAATQATAQAAALAVDGAIVHAQMGYAAGAAQALCRLLSELQE